MKLVWVLQMLSYVGVYAVYQLGTAILAFWHHSLYLPLRWNLVQCCDSDDEDGCSSDRLVLFSEQHFNSKLMFGIDQIEIDL